jgi:hypothetical protein
MSKVNQDIISELTEEHLELIHKTKEYWINRTLHGGSDFTVEDIRDDINWLCKTIGNMNTDKPHIFVFDSYSTYQLGYNLLKLAVEDNNNSKLNKTGKNLLKESVLERVWDLIWFGVEAGKSIHEALDSHVKRDIQDKVWESIARNTGDNIGMGVWDVLRQNVDNSMQQTVWINLFKSIALPGAKAIRSKVTEQVWEQCLNQLSALTGETVGEKVRKQIETTFSELLSNSDKKLSSIDHFIGMGNWAGWMAFYDFFYQAGIIKPGDGVPEEWLRFRRILDKGIWTMAWYNGCVLICKLPKRVRREPASRQLHSLEGPAVEWQDGTGQYFIHGVNFSEGFIDNLGTPPGLWSKIAGGKMTWAEVFFIRNIEQRRIAMRVYGPAKIMKDAKAVLIDRSERGNELYKIEAQIATIHSNGKVTFKKDNGTSTTNDNETLIPEMRIAYYKDPSTERWYHSFVPENIDHANEAMAWKLQMSTNDYLKELKVEA